MDVEALAAAPVRRLVAYDPGHDLPRLRERFPGRLVELGSNENSFGPSPRVAEALAALGEKVWRYPDPNGRALRARLAARHGVTPDRIALGNGSHELLMQLVQAFAGPGDRIACSRFGFAVYPIAARAVGAEPVAAPALPREAAMARGHDADALAEAGRGAKMLFLANPNNPTGTWLSRDALARVVDALPRRTLVVVDEAYADYVDAPDWSSALELREGRPNLVVTRTFSKAYALAGLRIGYMVAEPQVVGLIERLRESFNINAAAHAAALASLDDPEHVAACCARTRAERSRVAAAARDLGLFVHPSQTNFLLVDFDRDAVAVEARLLDRGVVVRPMGGYGLETCLRVTVGAPAENDAFLDALGSALA